MWSGFLYVGPFGIKITSLCNCIVSNNTVFDFLILKVHLFLPKTNVFINNHSLVYEFRLIMIYGHKNAVWLKIRHPYL